MKGRLLLVLGLFVLLSFWIHMVRIYSVEVRAVDGYPVHNLDTGFNYTTIQKAINANETLDGHTIFVESGIYYEHIVMNKSLSLMGEGKEKTVIDGNGNGTAVYIERPNDILMRFRVANAFDGIIVFSTAWNTTIRDNIVSDNIDYGIGTTGPFYGSPNNYLVKDNIVKNNRIGIHLGGCFNVTLRHNKVRNNSDYGIQITSSPPQPNEVKGSHRSVIVGNDLVENGVGLDLLGSDNRFFHNNFLYNTKQVEVHYRSDYKNSWSNNYVGEGNYWSNYNGTDVFINKGGVRPGDWIEYDLNWTLPPAPPYAVWTRRENLAVDGSVITVEIVQEMSDGSFRNDTATGDVAEGTGAAALIFIPAGLQPGDSVNIEGFGVVSINGTAQGTFLGTERTVLWSSFQEKGFDVFVVWDKERGVALEIGTQHVSRQGVTTIKDTNIWTYPSDGIGDSPYVIDVNNIDRYPLMGMFHSFEVFLPPYPLGGSEYVNVVSNSTVEDLDLLVWLSSPNQYLQPGQRFLSFHATGEDATGGFCRVMIPRTVLNGSSYTVLVDWNPVDVTKLQVSNSTHAYLYFTYQHSQREITIIPEFPSIIILPLFMIAALTAITLHRRHRRTSAR